MAGKVVSDSSGGGQYFKPDDGMYLLEFVEIEETTRPVWQSDEQEPAWRWKALMYDFASKQPVIDPETKQQAVYQDRTKQSLHIRSNGYKRVAAFLKRDPAVGETEEELFAAMPGKRCFGTFSGGWLKAVVRTPEGF